MLLTRLSYKKSLDSSWLSLSLRETSSHVVSYAVKRSMRTRTNSEQGRRLEAGPAPVEPRDDSSLGPSLTTALREPEGASRLCPDP